MRKPTGPSPDMRLTEHKHVKKYVLWGVFFIHFFGLHKTAEMPLLLDEKGISDYNK